MTEFDPDGFARAVTQFADGADAPYTALAESLAHVRAAELPPTSFGLINAGIVGGDYRDGQEYVATNLRTGVHAMRQVMEGLVQVAANYADVERANLVRPNEIAIGELSIGHRGGESGPVQLARAGLAAEIGVLAATCAGLATASTSFALSASVGAAMWALYNPDDAALDTAHGHWVEAAAGLDAFRESAHALARAISDTWSSEAREMFLRYMDAFVTEVNTCKEAVDTAVRSLEDVHEALRFEERAWLATSVANLLTLIAWEVFGVTFPPARPAIRAVQEVIGVMFSVSVTSWVAIAASAVKAGLLSYRSQASASFVTEKSDESRRIGFERVALSSDDLTTLTATLAGS